LAPRARRQPSATPISAVRDPRAVRRQVEVGPRAIHHVAHVGHVGCRRRRRRPGHIATGRSKTRTP
jgi:hypothetical protein